MLTVLQENLAIGVSHQSSVRVTEVVGLQEPANWFGLGQASAFSGYRVDNDLECSHLAFYFSTASSLSE